MMISFGKRLVQPYGQVNKKMNNQEHTAYQLDQERTLLAAERTFSAWIRTALAAMASGLGVLRLIVFKTEMHRIVAHIMGETLILWGYLIIALASVDYKITRSQLKLAKNFKSSHLGFAILIAPLMIVALLLILVTLP